MVTEIAVLGTVRAGLGILLVGDLAIVAPVCWSLIGRGALWSAVFVLLFEALEVCLTVFHIMLPRERVLKIDLVTYYEKDTGYIAANFFN